ncbi:MAG: RNA-binding protein [Gemmatimonadetes bacterium]|nr:RNA-binding protein [Gemmatimonadota bacterium]
MREEQAPRDGGGDATVRLDQWLWAARFFKTRSLAADAIDGGKADVNGQRAKRSRSVREGDRVSLRQGPVTWELLVRDVAERRGPAEAAQRLYEETPEGRVRREAMQAQARAMALHFGHDDGRPDKRDRRALRRLKGER